MKRPMVTRSFIALLLTVSTVLLTFAYGVPDQAQQGGDQFLDGIGETGLVARYVLNGNVEDSSRNQFHATLRGTGGTFVEDPQPRRVLLLTGDGSHLELPAQTLSNEDTISVTAWLFLPTGASGPIFDFGRDAANRLFATASAAGLRASLVANGKSLGETAADKAIPENQWVHVAVVTRSGRSRADDVSGRREGRPGCRRCGQCSAHSSVHRPLTGRRCADAARAAARLPHLSHRADRAAGGGHPSQRTARPSDHARPRCPAAGDLHRRHSARIAARIATRQRPRRYCEHGRRNAPAAALHRSRCLPRQRKGTGGPVCILAIADG